MQARTSLVLVGAAVAGLALSGCGSAESGDASSAASTVSGVVSSDVPASSVALRDASDPASARTTVPGADGSFSFDAAGLAPPFVLRAENGRDALYTIVLRSGNADINELTNVAVAGAVRGEDADEAWSRWGEHEDEEEREHDGADRIGSVIRDLRTVLKPLFDLYHVARIGGDDDDGDVSGMRALLRDVSFTVKDHVVTVTNRATGGVIFSGPLNDLASGVFHPENMPPGPGGTTPPPVTCTSFTYNAWTPAVCPASGQQTRTVATASPAGCTGGSPVLGRTCTPPPPPPVTCTSFTYNAWTPAVCPASGQQTRTVATASPAGCTGGSPVLGRTCTPPPPPPVTCTSFTYSTWSPAVCPASGQQTRTVVSSAPAGCTGGTPVLTQTCTPPPPPPVTCTSFTYSTWSPAVCPANGQQTRTVVSSAPAGCTGGTPVLTQTCTPPPPPPVTCNSFTYSTWSPAVCPANGQQTRTVVSSAPAGCTGGTPVLTQTCTPPPPPPVTCTSFTYSTWSPAVCPASGQQTRTVVSSAPAGCTGGTPVLTQTCTPPPPPPVTCTSFTYNAWSPAVCPTSGLQTRTVAIASPSGCTGGSPVLTQSCTPPPPPLDGAALYTQSCSRCHGALSSSDISRSGRTVSGINSAGMTRGLPADQIQAISTALLAQP